MKPERKLHLGNAIPRFIFVGISILLQLGWLLLTILVLNESVPWIGALTRLLAVLVVLQLNSKQNDAAYKMPWIMLILTLPVMGLSLYLMMNLFGDMGNIGKRMKAVRDKTRPQLSQDSQVIEDLQSSVLPGVGIGTYLHNQMGCPVYRNTDAAYYPEAKDAFSRLKEDLENAESFIFMEYFIVSGDSAFQELADILIRKARQGVDVRVMYDDVGSVGYVNLLFAKRLADAGIHCMVFNPVVPFLNVFMNHRDHRKITVIDGKVGFTGGSHSNKRKMVFED